jgi:hypothetical protein
MSAFGGKRTLGGLAFSDRFFQLRAELWAVSMSVHLRRVLSCGVDEFIFVVG